MPAVRPKGEPPRRPRPSTTAAEVRRAARPALIGRVSPPGADGAVDRPRGPHHAARPTPAARRRPAPAGGRSRRTAPGRPAASSSTVLPARRRRGRPQVLRGPDGVLGEGHLQRLVGQPAADPRVQPRAAAQRRQHPRAVGQRREARRGRPPRRARRSARRAPPTRRRRSRRAAAGRWRAPGRGAATGTAPTGAGQPSASAHQATARRCSGSSLRTWVERPQVQLRRIGLRRGHPRQRDPAVAGDLAVQRDGRRLPAAGRRQRVQPGLAPAAPGPRPSSRAASARRRHCGLVALGGASSRRQARAGGGAGMSGSGCCHPPRMTEYYRYPQQNSRLHLWSPAEAGRAAPSGRHLSNRGTRRARRKVTRRRSGTEGPAENPYRCWG